MCKAVVSTPFFSLEHQAYILICPFKISISGCPSDTSNSTRPEQNVLPTPRPPPEAPMQHFFSQSSKTQHPSQAPKPEAKAGVTSAPPSSPSLTSANPERLAEVDLRSASLSPFSLFPIFSWCPRSPSLGLTVNVSRPKGSPCSTSLWLL